MDSADRKILMLKRTTKRLQRHLAGCRGTIDALNTHIEKLQGRIKMLSGKARGNGTSVPVPAGLEACYEYAMTFATEFNYSDGSTLDVWKDPENYKKKGAADLLNQDVITWNVVKFGDGLYDLEFVREWTYK